MAETKKQKQKICDRLALENEGQIQEAGDWQQAGSNAVRGRWGYSISRTAEDEGSSKPVCKQGVYLSWFLKK